MFEYDMCLCASEECPRYDECMRGGTTTKQGIYTISFLFLLTFNVSKCQDSLHMLQQNQYNDSNNRYVRWLFDNPKSVFLSLDFISMIIILIAYFLNNSL